MNDKGTLLNASYLTSVHNSVITFNYGYRVTNIDLGLDFTPDLFNVYTIVVLIRPDTAVRLNFPSEKGFQYIYK